MKTNYLLLLILSCFSLPLSGQLSGELVVGAGGDYLTIAEAVADINLQGAGPGGVTFLINEGETFYDPVPAITVSGTEAGRIVFRNSGDPGINNPTIELTGSGDDDPAIDLDGSSFISFEGIDIDCPVFDDTGLEKGFYLHNGAGNNIIRNCTINLNQNNENGTAGIRTTGACSYNKFYNNLVTDCKTGYLMTGGGGQAEGNEIGTENGGENVIMDIYGNGISLEGQAEMMVFNTLIADVHMDNYTTAVGIGINDGGPYYIHDNEITGITSSSTMANPQGVSLNADVMYFYNNRIHDVWAQTIWGKATGVFISGGVSNVYNNLVFDIRSPGSNEQKATVGMNVIGGTEVHLWFNTVYLDYASDHAENTSAALHVSDLAGSVDLRNNIFVNRVDITTGELATVFWKSSPDLSNIAGETDHNCYHIPDPDINRLIFWDGTTGDQGIAAFKVRMWPREQNSIAVNPPFMNPYPPYNFHIDPSITTSLDNGGITIESAGFDFEYDPRSEPPDIGADEFTLPTLVKFETSTEEYAIFTTGRKIHVRPVIPEFTGEISVYNLLGQEISRRNYRDASSVMHTVELKHSGLFLVSILTQKGNFTKKVYLP